MSSSDSLAYFSDEGAFVLKEIEGDGIPLDNKNFPDSSLLNSLKRFDANGDSHLNDDEIASVDELSVYNSAALDSIGIFKNLKDLTVCCNATQLDVSGFTLLEKLDCSYNNLQMLDLTANTALEELDCSSNNLQELDLTANTALEELDCSSNNLQELGLTANTALEKLDCSYNNLQKLDLTANTALEKLNCSHNRLSKLDLTKTKVSFSDDYDAASYVGNQFSTISVLMTTRQLTEFGSLSETYNNQRVSINGGGVLNPEQLDRIDVNITAPVVGNEHNDSATVTSSEVLRVRSDWYVCDKYSKDMSDWKLMEPYETYEYGKYYLANVTVTLLDSYYIPGFGIYAEINGKITDEELSDVFVDPQTASLNRIYGPLGRTDVYREVWDYEGEWSVNSKTLTYTESGKAPAEFCRFDIDYGENVSYYIEPFDSMDTILIVLEDGNGDSSCWIKKNVPENKGSIRLDYYIPAGLELNWSLSPENAATVSPTMVSPIMSAPATLTMRAQKLTTLEAADGVSVSTFGDESNYRNLELKVEKVSGDAVNNVEKAAVALNGGEAFTRLYRLRLCETETGTTVNIAEGDVMTVSLPLPFDWTSENIKVFAIDSNSGELTDMKAKAYPYLGKVEFKTSRLGSFIIVNKDAVCPHSTTKTVNAKTATCTAQGYTGDKVCTVCGETVEKGTATAKKAHKYENGKCAVCGAKDPKYIAAPTVSVSVVASSGAPKAAWSKISGAAKYEVYRATSKTGTYTKLATTTALSYTDSKATAGKTCYYKVRAVASDGTTKSAFSAVKSAIADCAQPVIKTANVTKTGKIKISWAKITGAGKYEIYRATSKTGTYTKLASTTALSYTDSKATAGKTYYYKVKAICTASTNGNSAYSAVKSGICKTAQPVIKAENVTKTGKIKISWAKITGAGKYEVYRATSKTGTYTKLATTTALSYTDKKATAGKTYYYKVKAICTASANGNSAYSEIKSATGKLAQPVAEVTLFIGKPKISWAKVSGAVKYEVYRATSKTGKYTKLSSPTVIRYADETTKAGKTYYYKVKAICKTAAGSSAYSTVISIKSK